MPASKWSPVVGFFFFFKMAPPDTAAQRVKISCSHLILRRNHLAVAVSFHGPVYMPPSIPIQFRPCSNARRCGGGGGCQVTHVSECGGGFCFCNCAA